MILSYTYTVFTVGTNQTYAINGNGDNLYYVCFAEKTGYSQSLVSYTGNNN